MSIDGLELEERQVAELLECRYGDGMVYLPKTKPRQLLSIATSSLSLQVAVSLMLKATSHAKGECSWHDISKMIFPEAVFSLIHTGE